jgi:type III secretion protein R
VSNFDPIALSLSLALLALVPTVAIVSTSFLKIAIVLSLVRNAMGVQQIPPTIALYGLAIILTAYIMAPVAQNIQKEVAASPAAAKSIPAMYSAVTKGAEPLRNFMFKHSDQRQRDFFVRTATTLWGPSMTAALTEKDYVVLIPAFMVTELTEAFEIGFLIFLPFVIIDLIVSNILLAMGMMMVSPVMISMPLKLFLFVMADGWTKLIQGLVFTYA